MFNFQEKMLMLKDKYKLTWEAWGIKSNKSAAAIKKLFEADANPTVATLDSVLPSLGASLFILTDEEAELLNSAKVLEEKVASLERLCEIQQSRIETFDSETQKQSDHEKELMQAIKQQQETINTYIQRMYAREQAVDRKDARIVQLEKALGIWDVEKMSKTNNDTSSNEK